MAVPVIRAAGLSSYASPGISQSFLDQPEGGTTGDWSLLFSDPSSTVDSFELRYRTRWRAVTSESMGDWGAWTSWTETIAETWQGRRSAHPVSFDSLAAASGNDYGEIEFQVREAGGQWSSSELFPIRLVPTMSFALSQVGNDTYTLDTTTAWTRHDTRVSIQEMKVGSTRIFNGWKHYTGIPAGGYVTIPASDFDTRPKRGDTVVIRGEYRTRDGAIKGFTASSTVTWSECNTPIIVLDPDTENSRVGITVTDAGDKSAAIESVVVYLDNGSDIDVVPATLGQKVWHNVPPYDITLTYTALAQASSGALAQASASTSIASNGRLTFSWGDGLSRILSLRANLDWESDFSSEREYYEVAEGLPKVFFGDADSHVANIDGDFIYPYGRSEVEELAHYKRGKVVYRAAYGERRLLSIDGARMRDASGNIQTEVRITAREVQ